MCAWLTCTDPYSMAEHSESLDPIWPLIPSGETARQPRGCSSNSSVLEVRTLGSTFSFIDDTW